MVWVSQLNSEFHSVPIFLKNRGAVTDHLWVIFLVITAAESRERGKFSCRRRYSSALTSSLCVKIHSIHYRDSNALKNGDTIAENTFISYTGVVCGRAVLKLNGGTLWEKCTITCVIRDLLLMWTNTTESRLGKQSEFSLSLVFEQSFLLLVCV